MHHLHRRLPLLPLAAVMTTAAIAQTTQPEAPQTQPAAPTTRPASVEGNPPAPGFNAEGSDPKAIEIADEVMERLGGRAAWENTRYVSWKFFAGERLFFWDRHLNRIRLEGLAPRSGKFYIVVLNMNTGEGKAWQEGLRVAEHDLPGALEAVRDYWFNDAYWLFMPYKLKDTGVTLKYVGEKELPDGRPADVLQLTFDRGIGRTWKNKYHVFVAKDTKLVEQWEYYALAEDETPQLVTPWDNWFEYGGIWLSGDRGVLNEREMVLTDITIFKELPDDVFTGGLPYDWASMRRAYGV